MMKDEKLFNGPGDVLNDFFGVPVMKIVGILEPTDTELDKFHIMNSETFAQLNK